MALNLAALTPYTKQEIAPLLTEAVFAAKTQDLIKQGGILLPKTKSSVAIPKMSTGATFQTDACGFNPSGDTAITQAEIEVGKVKVEESICVKDFEAYFTQEALRAGSTYEDFEWSDFSTKFSEQKNKAIAKLAEVGIWKGDKNSLDANLNKFDGLMKVIKAGSPVYANQAPYIGTVATSITVDNVIDVLNAVYQAIPVEIVDATDLKVMVGNDVYRTATLAYQKANLFNYKVDADASQSFIIPGTNVELVSVNGLNGTSEIYATTLSNIAMAFDLEAEQTNYKIWYSEDFNEVRFRAAFKLGVGVAYTNLCVVFILD